MQNPAAINITIETEREDDGRWIAEVPELPGVMAYGATEDEARRDAEILALRVLAERLETGESRALPISIVIAAE
jgi:predicted RNase H-like HicB family nuclease